MQDGLSEKYSREFEAGTVLFEAGDEGGEMYIVQTGTVRISVTAGDIDKTLANLGPGEFFGEMAVLSGRPRTATATVMEDSQLLVIDSETFETLLAQHPEIAARLIRKLSDRLERTDQVVEILLHREPRARVILGLSSLARDYGEETSDGIVIRVTTAQVADHCGLEVGVALEAIKKLERAKLISLAGTHAILVRDVVRIEEFLSYLEMKERFGDL